LHDQPPFGRRLAELRKAHGLTQREFGKLIGLSQSMVVYYERRAKNPTAEFLGKAAEALGITVDELLGQDNGSKSKRKPGRTSELERRLQAVQDLPRSKQKFVIDFIDTVVRQEQA